MVCPTMGKLHPVGGYVRPLGNSGQPSLYFQSLGYLYCQAYTGPSVTGRVFSSASLQNCNSISRGIATSEHSHYHRAIDTFEYEQLPSLRSTWSKCQTAAHKAEAAEGATNMTIATLIRIDEEIQKDVLAELKWDAQVQPNEIGVAVKDGVVTLTGWVDSYLKKWAAEDAAHRVSGVRAVANEIEVKLATERTDADIAAAAVRALEWDSSVPADTIKVTVSKGWVTLRGEVEWQYQKEDAERIVRRLSGVKGVSNLITIKPSVTPAELKEKIE